jgi:enterochelin esterase-like enzyme
MRFIDRTATARMTEGAAQASPPTSSRWRLWLRRTAYVLCGLTLLLGTTAWYGYQQNWERYIYYRHLPDWRRTHEKHLIKQLAADATRTAGSTSASTARPASNSSSNLGTPVASVANVAPPTPTIDYLQLPNGRVTDASIDSPVLGKRLDYRIYLPPGYDDPRFANQRYPVLYLLHGAPGGMHDWVDGGSANQTADALIKMRKIAPLIIVMPDGSLGDPHHDTQWGNSPVTGERVEDALIQDLIPAIDQTYRTLPGKDDRAIGGLSAGGYGAVNIALHHPEAFTVAFSISGYFQAEQTYDGHDLWGSDAVRQLNTPLDSVAQQAVHMQIIQARGEQDTFAEAQRFDQALTQHGIDHQFLPYDGQGHTWDFWRDRLLDALTYTNQFMRPAQPGQ